MEKTTSYFIPLILLMTLSSFVHSANAGAANITSAKLAANVEIPAMSIQAISRRQ